MTTIIQVVENSDRFHVSENGIPDRTFMFGGAISQAHANLEADAHAYRLALRRQQEKFEIKLLPQEIK